MASGPSCSGAIRSLQFWGVADGVMRVNKIPMPEGVQIIWTSGRCDELRLEGFAAGQARDVLACPGAPYVLKLQAAKWHK